MNNHHHHHRYTGAVAFAPSPHHSVPEGHCRSCGHPSGQCGCGCRTCRKEAKELLVQSTAKEVGANLKASADTQTLFSMMAARSADSDTTRSSFAAAANTEDAQRGIAAGTAFIGGGCCVHLSAEYTPVSPTADSLIGILVRDSEGTLLAWVRLEKAGTHYQIKEGIITTRPGATLTVIVVNMVARVRWCEVFSC